jgi:hypothetical protein
MKHELKIEFKEKERLEELIQESYFKDSSMGKLIGKKHSILIKNEDPLFIVFKGLNNNTIRLMNDEMMEGTMRFIVVQDNDYEVNLFPINNYCIIQDKKYSFY